MLKHILEQREPVRECLLTELFVAMMVLSSRARLPGKRTWRRLPRDWEHISCSVCSSGLAIVTSGSAGSHQPLLFCPICAWRYIWLVLTIGSSVYGPRNDVVRTITLEMREKVFTLRMRLKYDLQDLGLRKEL
jgi:hypothetical protein